MSIVFDCPYCGVELEASESHARESAVCPSCEERFIIPNVSKSAAEETCVPAGAAAG